MVIHELNSTELIQMHNQSIISQRIVMLLHASKNSYIKCHFFYVYTPTLSKIYVGFFRIIAEIFCGNKIVDLIGERKWVLLEVILCFIIFWWVHLAKQFYKDFRGGFTSTDLLGIKALLEQ